MVASWIAMLIITLVVRTVSQGANEDTPYSPTQVSLSPPHKFGREPTINTARIVDSATQTFVAELPCIILMQRALNPPWMRSRVLLGLWDCVGSCQLLHIHLVYRDKIFIR